MSSKSQRSRRRRVAAALLVTVALLGGATGVASAQETRAGGSVVVEAGETVNGVQAVGGTVVVRGTVDGDVDALAGSVVVEQDGQVTGDVRATAGSVTVLGTVNGSLEASAGAVSIGEGAAIGGDVRVATGDLRIAGSVGGDVEAGVETLRLTSTAAVAGDLRYAERADFVREDGATVGGTVSAVENLEVDVGFGGFSVPDPGPFNVVFGIYWTLATLLLGAILLAAFPRFTAGVAAEVSDRPLRSGGVGFLGLVGIPIVLVMVAISIIGIPITFLGFMAYGLLVFLSIPVAEYAAGAWVLSYADVDNRWAALVVGVVGVAVLSRLPLVGWLVELLVFLLGLGAVLVLLYRGFRRSREGGDRGSAESPSEGGAVAGSDD